MTVSLIWAQASNGVIGAAGTLPWHLPEDLARFKRLTTGATVVMGRRTWESLPDTARPLPGRRNIVLSRDPLLTAPGAEVAADLASALAAASGDVWVIGGASVYAEALPHAQVAVVTELADAFDGDVLAPRLPPGWTRTGRQPDDGWQRSRTGLRFRVSTYHRATADTTAAAAAAAAGRAGPRAIPSVP